MLLPRVHGLALSLSLSLSLLCVPLLDYLTIATTTYVTDTEECSTLQRPDRGPAALAGTATAAGKGGRGGTLCVCVRFVGKLRSLWLPRRSSRRAPDQRGHKLREAPARPRCQLSKRCQRLVSLLVFAGRLQAEPRRAQDRETQMRPWDSPNILENQLLQLPSKESKRPKRPSHHATNEATTSDQAGLSSQVLLVRKSQLVHSFLPVLGDSRPKCCLEAWPARVRYLQPCCRRPARRVPM